MDLHLLNIFRTVARLGSISQAAKELQYAQSNITMKIQQLEKSLQSPLFYRYNRGMTLTDKGSLLLAYSEKIFHLIEETEAAMKDDQTPGGSLIIGSMETTAAVRLPPFLSTYHRTFPKVDLTLKTGPTEQNIQGVLQHQIDGAFIAAPVEHPALIQKEVFEEEMVLITDTKHPDIASIKDIQTDTVLVFRSGCAYREKLKHWLHQEGVIPAKVMELGTMEAIIGCVSAGLGLSMLPLSVVSKHIQEGSLKQHSIPHPYEKVKTVFIYRKDRYIPASLTAFINLFPEKVKT